LRIIPELFAFIRLYSRIYSDPSFIEERRMASHSSPTSSPTTRIENTLAKKLRDAPFDFSYYGELKFNPPLKEEVYSMLDNALFPAPQLTEKAAEFIRKPTKCGRKFISGESVRSCDCGRDINCLLCDDCYDPEQHQNCNSAIRRDSMSRSNTYLDGGGFCDCGIAEAWKVEIDCHVHSRSGDNNESHQKSDSSQLSPVRI
jgi:hypothetical protein